MSVLEIWGAEYQENDCLLIKPESRDLLQAVCDRERCLMQVREGFWHGCKPLIRVIGFNAWVLAPGMHGEGIRQEEERWGLG
jgi:hypothetical protein